MEGGREGGREGGNGRIAMHRFVDVARKAGLRPQKREREGGREGGREGRREGGREDGHLEFILGGERLLN
jgi:hypothetical protein